MGGDNSSVESLFDVFKQVMRVFETDAEAHHGVVYLHDATLLVGEGDEDGAGRMDGQRLAIEQVRGTPYQLQTVDKGEGSLLRFEADGE